MRRLERALLRVLRRFPARWHRPMARAAFWAGGWASRVRTPRRTWRMVSADPLVTSFAGWRWGSCGLSMRLLSLSMRLDWEHWDHWALEHDRCAGVRCAVCGGVDCEGDNEFSELGA